MSPAQCSERELSRERAVGAFRFARAWRGHVTVGQCYREGFFKTAEEAQGAFTLVYEMWPNDADKRGLAQCMGLTIEDLDRWLSHKALPEYS